MFTYTTMIRCTDDFRSRLRLYELRVVLELKAQLHLGKRGCKSSNIHISYRLYLEPHLNNWMQKQILSTLISSQIATEQNNRFLERITDSSRGLTWTIRKKFAKYSRNISEIFPKYLRNIREIFAKNSWKICEKLNFANFSWIFHEF